MSLSSPVVFFLRFRGLDVQASKPSRMEFPDDWPDCCPPADVQDASGTIFRIVKTPFLAEEDFLTHHESGKMRKADPCLRCGLSVFPDIDGAAHQRDLFPVLGNLIAGASLESCHGKMKQTPTKNAPKHLTWWPYKGVQRHPLFTIVETEAEE